MNSSWARFALRLSRAALLLSLLGACAGPMPTGPATDEGRASPAQAMPPAEGLPIVVIDVQPTLREAVRRAASGHPSLSAARFAPQPSADADYTLVLRFASAVDRSGQVSNQSGAVIGGPATLLLGAITPWPCPTRHTLDVTVRRRDGTQAFTEAIVEDEKKIGTMLWCPTVSEPGEALATRLADFLFRKLEREKVLAAPVAR